jgi:hypothetical protein
VDAPDDGASGRVALAATGIAPVAVRATPQVVVAQRAVDRDTTELAALTARVYGVTHVRQGGDPGFTPAADEAVTRFDVRLAASRPNKAIRVQTNERLDTTSAFRPAFKLRVADLPDRITMVSREAPPSTDSVDGAAQRTSRRNSKLDLTLTARSGPAAIWSEPLQRPFDGPRDTATADAGIGVTWLGIDALPRRLIITPLVGGRYASGSTRPPNFSDIPSDWTRDGLRLQASDELVIRDMLQAAWDRDESATGRFAWGLTYIRELRLAPDTPTADGTEPPALFLWSPSRRPPAGGDFAEPDGAALGIKVDAGLRATLDLDKYEQIHDQASPRWDALPGGGWKLLAEVQLDRYGSEVTLSELFGVTDPVRGGDGPGEWWVRSTGAWPWWLGGGSVAFGNTGGPPFHKNRIFP